MSEYDIEAPGLRVSVYVGGRLVTRIACETPDEAAGIAAQWEEHPGYRCEVEDLSSRHGAEDVLAPEAEDLTAEDEYRDGSPS